MPQESWGAQSPQESPSEEQSYLSSPEAELGRRARSTTEASAPAIPAATSSSGTVQAQRAASARPRSVRPPSAPRRSVRRRSARSEALDRQAQHGEAFSTAKRSTAKRSTAKRSTAKRSTAKRSTAKRSTAKRTAKRSTAKRCDGEARGREALRPRSARREAEHASTAKRSTAKRCTAKRSTAKRSTAKRSTAKRSTQAFHRQALARRSASTAEALDGRTPQVAAFRLLSTWYPPSGQSQEGECHMPQKAWSNKRERQYEHIKDSAKERGASTKRAKQIAAATVNKERARKRRGEDRVASSTHDISSGRRGGLRSGTNRPKGRTKEQLYNEAKRRGHQGPLAHEQGAVAARRRRQEWLDS